MVLSIDPMNVRAYIGLADAYLGKGDIAKAIETLQTGYDKTGDSGIKDKLESIIDGAGAADTYADALWQSVANVVREVIKKADILHRQILAKQGCFCHRTAYIKAHQILCQGYMRLLFKLG